MAKAEKIKIVKCRYSHCLHESKELNAEDAVKVGKSAYYHKDCCQTKENIAEIADTFVKRVDKNVAYPLLTKTINNIVFNKKVDSDIFSNVLDKASKDYTDKREVKDYASKEDNSYASKTKCAKNVKDTSDKEYSLSVIKTSDSNNSFCSSLKPVKSIILCLFFNSSKSIGCSSSQYFW